MSVPDGYVRFNVTDAGGGTIVSYWQTVRVRLVYLFIQDRHERGR